jgi:chorismate mutase/prephenate dehydratase
MAPRDDEIEKVDLEIIELISRRTEAFIRKLKVEKTDRGLFPFDDRSRLSGLIKEANHGPLANQTFERIYTEIFAGSISTLAPVTVAFLGPEGTFTNIAVNEFFGGSATLLPQRTIQDVFHHVETGKALYGVVPVENSTEGSVTYTLDELAETSINIISEKYIRITYQLLSKTGNLRSIRKIYAHSQTLGQCKGWIRTNLPEAEIVSVESTSRSAELAALEEGTAAIASGLAAGIYGLNVLATTIEDSRQNYTRFFLIGEKSGAPTGNDKTSIVCAVKDRPGALLDMLRPFADVGINMTKIESRPDKKKMWEYNFFIDFIGHQDEAIVKKALGKIKNDAIFLKILGSYPVGN